MNQTTCVIVEVAFEADGSCPRCPLREPLNGTCLPFGHLHEGRHPDCYTNQLLAIGKSDGAWSQKHPTVPGWWYAWTAEDGVHPVKVVWAYGDLAMEIEGASYPFDERWWWSNPMARPCAPKDDRG